MKHLTTTSRKSKFWRGEIRTEVASRFGLTVPANDSEKTLSPNQAAELLGITGEAVKQWIYHRRLPAVKLVNGYWKIRASDLQKLIDDRHCGPNRPILVASTDPRSINVISSTLKEINVDVHETGNFLDAALKASNLSPAAIVVDVSSFRNAWRFMKKLKALKPLENIPIMIITTGTLSVVEMDTAVGLDIRACLEKPIQRDAIMREMRLLMGIEPAVQ